MSIDAVKKVPACVCFPMGFDSVKAVNFGVHEVTSWPKAVFVPYRLVIPRDIAPRVMILAVTIGGRAQVKQLPGTVFSDDSCGVTRSHPISWDTIQPEKRVSIFFENLEPARDLRFIAALLRKCSCAAKVAAP